MLTTIVCGSDELVGNSPFMNGLIAVILVVFLVTGVALNAYFALVVTFVQRYDSKAGVGTIVSLMLPYVVLMLVLWTGLFAVWYMLGLPWGLETRLAAKRSAPLRFAAARKTKSAILYFANRKGTTA
jgi:p-aminobenzoyl-glutamate transporter AbgT